MSGAVLQLLASGLFADFEIGPQTVVRIGGPSSTTYQARRTLTASAQLGDGSYSYVWGVVGGSGYMVLDAQAGNTIRASVTYDLSDPLYDIATVTLAASSSVATAYASKEVRVGLDV